MTVHRRVRIDNGNNAELFNCPRRQGAWDTTHEEIEMATDEIAKGGVYTNGKGLAREVIEITPDEYVIYHDYSLHDGKPIGRHCRCSLGTFMRWAARPLTAEEDRALRRVEGQVRDKRWAETLISAAIVEASDEQIRREFYRRGLVSRASL
jgi:hypothetical protein